MSLLDVLTGMRNGPGGATGRGGLMGTGISPIAGAVLGLLAYKAFKGMTAGPRDPSAPSMGGGLGDMLRRTLGGGQSSGPTAGLGAGLGGLLGGGALAGGLGDLMRQFQQAGRGDVADTWVSRGDNRDIASPDLEKVLTPEQISFLMQQTGLSREDLLAGLSQQLPKAVDHLTPDGRIPSDGEMAKLI